MRLIIMYNDSAPDFLRRGFKFCEKHIIPDGFQNALSFMTKPNVTCYHVQSTIVATVERRQVMVNRVYSLPQE